MLDSSKPRYRWDEPQPARTGGTLTVQEDAESPGHVIQHWLSWLVGTSVTPEVVREIIRRDLLHGWKPASRKAPIHSKVPDGSEIDVENIETKLSVIRDVHDS